MLAVLQCFRTQSPSPVVVCQVIDINVGFLLKPVLHDWNIKNKLKIQFVVKGSHNFFFLNYSAVNFLDGQSSGCHEARGG